MKESPAVLLINSLGTGGAERAVRAAAVRLRAVGRDVRIVCLERSSPSASSTWDIPVSFLSSLKVDASVVLKLAVLPFLAFRLSSFLSRTHSNVVMSHLFRANFVNVLAPALAGSRHRTILVNHTRISRLLSEGIQGRINWLLCRLLYPRADLVASVSRGASSECARLLGLPAGRSITLYDPIDTSATAAITGTAKRRHTIVTVGRLVSLKRYEDLIDSFARIADDFPGLHVNLVGDGPERSWLEQRAATAGLSDRVRFVGQLSEPAAALSEAAVFVSTSATEGFGMAIVEALAAGVPVIAADCAFGPREILSPSTDPTVLLGKESEMEPAPFGILYPVGSVVALETALRRILGDPALQAELARKGPQRAADFSVERSTAAYEKLLFA